MSTSRFLWSTQPLCARHCTDTLSDPSWWPSGYGAADMKDACLTLAAAGTFSLRQNSRGPCTVLSGALRYGVSHSLSRFRMLHLIKPSWHTFALFGQSSNLPFNVSFYMSYDGRVTRMVLTFVYSDDCGKPGCWGRWLQVGNPLTAPTELLFYRKLCQLSACQLAQNTHTIPKTMLQQP